MTEQMDISGEWYNELGSRMNLIVSGLSLTGSYETKVGRGSGSYKLYGMLVPGSEPPGEAVGFVVGWLNDTGSSYSVTTWSGQSLIAAGGQQEIVTTWLLTTETTPGDSWKSTLVGRDIFGRTPPSPGQAEAHARKHPWSHPRLP
jgi:hypothetical protein